MTSLVLHPLGGLLVNSEGKLTTDLSCCKTILNVGILVIRGLDFFFPQDNLVVKLNGVDIGTINNNYTGCSGRIFATTQNITQEVFYGGSCPNFDPIVEIPFNSFLQGINTIRLESIQQNGWQDSSGNIRVTQFVCINNILYQLKDNLSVGYNFPSGVGNGQTFTFEYP
jgi:hypothetical protein